MKNTENIKLEGTALLKVNPLHMMLPKKGKIAQIEYYRPLSLLSHVHRLFVSIVTETLSSKLDFHQPIELSGFRKGYGTNDHQHHTM